MMARAVRIQLQTTRRIEARPVASSDLLNPLASPSWRVERICEILCFVHDLTVAELHNADRVRRPPLINNRVFRDPEVAFSENSLHLETRRFAGVMTPQSLQIGSPEDSLARLGIVANGIVIVNVVFRIHVTDRRRLPVRIQSLTYLLLFHGLLQFLFGLHADGTRGMKPGEPVFTTLLSLCLV